MNREQALAILDLPRSQAEAAMVALWEKAEQWDRFQATAEDTSVSPTTPSGMRPVYLKPSSSRRCKKPGRKPGHPGACRETPERIDAYCAHRLKTCPQCGSAVGKPIRQHTRLIEDIPPVTPLVTAHTLHGYWCSHCKTIVAAKVTAALPRSSLGLRFVVYTAWLHYLVGVSVGNCVKTAAVSLGFPVSPGGLTLAWKNLATLLEGQYEAIGENIRHSAVLHADETGWRINGMTFWLWAFATRQYCYYLIDRRRGAAVVKQVLGTLFPGILITDFWGAYNTIETLAKQRCYFHLFTELVKVDKRNPSATWKRCPHIYLVNMLNRVFAAQLGAQGIVSVQNPIVLPPRNAPQPDLAILAPSSIASKEVPRAQDVLLLIEVAHTTTDYDRDVKIPIYARHGIAEVWLFEVEVQRLSIYLEPGTRGYQRLLNPEKREIISPSLLPGVTINLADLW